MFMDYLYFRKLLLPQYVFVLFWILVGLSFLSGVFSIATGTGLGVLNGILTWIIGPIISRFVCEIVIAAFRALERLENIDNNTKR
ncbi:MAG: hypothetical protein AB7G15_02130 [Alphaproteobacteria bacterium]